MNTEIKRSSNFQETIQKHLNYVPEIPCWFQLIRNRLTRKPIARSSVGGVGGRSEAPGEQEAVEAPRRRGSRRAHGARDAVVGGGGQHQGGARHEHRVGPEHLRELPLRPRLRPRRRPVRGGEENGGPSQQQQRVEARPPEPRRGAVDARRRPRRRRGRRHGRAAAAATHGEEDFGAAKKQEEKEDDGAHLAARGREADEAGRGEQHGVRAVPPVGHRRRGGVPLAVAVGAGPRRLLRRRRHPIPLRLRPRSASLCNCNQPFVVWVVEDEC